METVMARNKPPALIVFGTGWTIKNVINQFQENCANQISTNIMVIIFMDNDPPGTRNTTWNTKLSSSVAMESLVICPMLSSR